MIISIDRLAMRFFSVAIFLLFPWVCCAQGLQGDPFEPKAMRLLSAEQYLDLESDLPQGLLAAVEAYHATRQFDQTIEQFISDRDSYFRQRLAALEAVMAAIPQDQELSPVVSHIRQAALNKKSYILAVPSMVHPYATKPEALSAVDKSLALKDAYWFEKEDPLHRAGKSMAIRHHLWQLSNVPNYFIFLDTVENDYLLNKYAPQSMQVAYNYSEEQRARHRLTFKEGLAYLEGQLFDTSEFHTIFSNQGFAIFVLGEDNHFYVNNHHRDQLHHSSEFAGMPVNSAGEIGVAKGKITYISNKSGHYAPDLSSFLYALGLLKAQGCNLDGVIAQLILREKGGELRIQYDAGSLLATQGHSLGCGISNGATPLHVAVLREQFALAAAAIGCSAIDAQDIYGETALHKAVQKGSAEWVAELLAHGANPRIYSSRGHAPIHIAALMGNRQLLELLLPGSGIELPTKSGETPLLLAASHGNREGFDFLRYMGASLDASDDAGSGILFYAVMSPDLSLLQELFLGPQVDNVRRSNHQGACLLHAFVAFGKRREMFDILMACGLDLNAVDNGGHNTMHYAIGNRNYRAVEALIDLGMAHLLVTPNSAGTTPFHLAAGKGDFHFLRKILPYVADVDIRDGSGNTALHCAVREGQMRNIPLLAARGADFFRYNNEGRAPIHDAAESRLFLLPELLIHVDQLNFADSAGNLPLHLAIIEKNTAAALYLIAYSSLEELTLPNNHGLNPLELARQSGKEPIIQAIEAKLSKG